MSNTSADGSRNPMIAGGCGVVAFLLSLWPFGFGFWAALLIGLIVAAIVFVILMMRSGDTATMSQTHPANSTTPASASGATAKTTAAVEPAAVAGSVPLASAAPAGNPVAAADVPNDGAMAATATPVETAVARSKSSTKAAPKPKKAAAKPKKPAVAAKPAAATKPAAAPKAKTAKAPATAAKPARTPVAPDGKPEMLDAPRTGGADDLKQIKGVGVKLEAMLNDMGVYHFDQIAGWRAAEVRWADENLKGFKGRVSRDEWVKQAKVLVKGGETAFSKKVKKGGVY